LLYNYEMENKKTMWYVLAAIAVVLILVGLWYFMGMKKDSNIPANTNTQVNVTADNPQDSVENQQEQNTETVNQEQVSQEEQARLKVIQDERAELLAEQARLKSESTTSASSSEGQSQAELERQQQIELELLNLKNQEEYPPLSDPGV